MTDLEKAARMALKGLERSESALHKARAALRQTLKQPAQQKPVGYVYSVHGERTKNACIESDVPNGTPLYTSPQRKPWVGLTVDECVMVGVATGLEMTAIHMIEAKLKEKNT